MLKISLPKGIINSEQLASAGGSRSVALEKIDINTSKTFCKGQTIGENVIMEKLVTLGTIYHITYLKARFLISAS